LRSSRAAISWRNAQRLSMIDIPTAKPVAMLEKRFGPLRSTSYFINEYVAGKSLQDYFRETNSLEEQLYVSKRITDLFNSLIGIQVSHGDLKATNILIASSKPILLDLDAMRLHRLPCRWRAAHQRDQKRFMKNWENQPEI